MHRQKEKEVVLVLRVESEEKLREELGLPKNDMYDMYMTLCVKEETETAREVEVEELGVEKVLEELAVEEVAKKVVVENGLVELVRRMDVRKVDGS